MASSPACAVGEQMPVVLPADLPVPLSSSLTDELFAGDGAGRSSLAAALAAAPDARRRRGRGYELTGVVTIAACACLTGVRSYLAIGEWAVLRVLRCSSAWVEPMTLCCRVSRRCAAVCRPPKRLRWMRRWPAGP